MKIQLHAKRKGADPEGEVIEILESQRRLITGKLQVTRGFAFLITEDKTLANDIFIPKDKLKGGKSGDKAIVRITEWPEEAKNPLGEVVDILGTAGDNNAEMNAILAEFDLPYKYPANVEKRKLPSVRISVASRLSRSTRKTLRISMTPFPPVSWIMAIGKLAFISPT